MQSLNQDFDFFKTNQYDQDHSGTDQGNKIFSRPNGHPQRSGNPNRGGGGEARNVKSILKNNSGPQKADTADDGGGNPVRIVRTAQPDRNLCKNCGPQTNHDHRSETCSLTPVFPFYSYRSSNSKGDQQLKEDFKISMNVHGSTRLVHQDRYDFEDNKKVEEKAGFFFYISKMEDHIYHNKWEKRWHPLREEWIVYSAHRNSRPWQGAGLLKPGEAPAYDPECYLCPGNKRVNGKDNPVYTDVFIFENDLPVVGKMAPEVTQPSNDLYKRGRALGIAKVVCYDPRHHVTLSQMKLAKVTKVFEAFQQEMIAFEKDPMIKFALIFENKGEAVGVSNPHPHCQIYATDFTFKLIEQQIRIADEYQKQKGLNLFEEIICNELKEGIRILAENENAVAFIPFFARYAYEVMIFPKRPHATLITMSEKEIADLGSVFHQVVRRMDRNFNISFPYVMSVMQAPVDGGKYPDFRMHLWLQPPFRQPGLIKYLAGPEIGGGNFMADTMPEEKAAELRAIELNADDH